MSKKMVSFSAMIQIDASIFVRFDAPADTPLHRLKEMALDEAPMPSVCHQCSKEVEVGDVMDVIEIHNTETNETVEETT